MPREQSIPACYEQQIITWWLQRMSPRTIEALLFKKYTLVTSHTSIQRLINKVAAGSGDIMLMTVIVRMRLAAGQVLCQHEDLGISMLMMSKVFGGSGTRSAEDLRELRGMDLTAKFLCRYLKMAGVGTKYGETVVARYKEQVDASVVAGGARDGINWFVEPDAGVKPGEKKTPPPEPVPGPASAHTSPPTAERWVHPAFARRPSVASPAGVPPPRDVVAEAPPPAPEVERFNPSEPPPAQQIESYAEGTPEPIRTVPEVPSAPVAPAELPVPPEVVAEAPLAPPEVERFNPSKPLQAQQIESYAAGPLARIRTGSVAPAVSDAAGKLRPLPEDGVGKEERADERAPSADGRAVVAGNPAPPLPTTGRRVVAGPH